MLNWTPVVIADFFLGTFFLVGGLWSLRTSENVRIKTIKYLKAVWLTFAIYFYLEAVSFLFLDLFWGRIYALIGFVATSILIIAIGYNYKDNFFSVWLFIIIIFGCIATYLAFTQPDAAKIEMVNGYYQVVWTGTFDIIGQLILSLFAFIFFGWVVVTLLYSPYVLRKYSIYFFIGAFITSMLSQIIYYIIESLLWTEICMCIGLLCCNYIIYKEPGILYILPFKAYRITVLDRNGNILIKYVWSRTSSIDLIYNILLSTESKTLEKIKTNLYLSKMRDSTSSKKLRLLRKIRESQNPKGLKISQNKENADLIVEMKYPEILVYESQLVIVKFEVSKITKFLRALINQFSIEFEIEFRDELEHSSIEKEKYETGYQLINKYFFMFPSNIITSSKDSFLISSESFRIDEELEEKIKELFPKEEDFNFIKCEIQRAPEITLKTINKIWEEI